MPERFHNFPDLYDSKKLEYEMETRCPINEISLSSSGQSAGASVVPLGDGTSLYLDTTQPKLTPVVDVVLTEDEPCINPTEIPVENGKYVDP